jgi:hypothetical protein
MNSFTNLNNFFNKAFQDSPKNIRLGIWGTKGSGKTLYLIMLYEALLQAEPKNWHIECDEIARHFVEKHLEEMDNTDEPGLLPPPTEKNKQIEIFQYILTPTSSNHITNSQVVLEFIDAPGEFYREILKVDAKVVKSKGENIVEEYQDIVEYLMKCDGIIFLLDPKSGNKTELYRTLLFSLFNEFKARSLDPDSKGKKLEQYMAFCVTKVDDDNELWHKAQNPQKLVHEVMGQKMWKYLPNFCYLELDTQKRSKLHKDNRCEFFAVSSIGRYYEKKDKQWYRALDNSQPENFEAPEENNNHYNYNNGYDPDVAQQNNAVPNDFEGFGLENNDLNNLNQQRAERIKQGVECKPINVIEPIEWLIKNIFFNRPLLNLK